MYTKIQALKESRFWNGLRSLISTVGVMANVGVLLFITATVFFRYVLKTSLYGMEEIIVLMAYWLYFIGGAYATATDGHIKADLVSVFVNSERAKYVMRFLAKIVELIVTIAFCIWGFRYFLYTGIAKGPITAGLRIPHIYMMLPIFIGYGLMAFFSLFQAVELGCLALGNDQKELEVNRDV